MKKQIITTAIALSILLTGTQISANTGKQSYIDTAKVVDAEPIYETVTVSIPEESCWSKPRRHKRYRSDNQHNSYTGTIAGGIISGVVGNQFGHDSGKKVMTVAGTLLGLSIGHDLSQQSSDNYEFNRRVDHRRQICETTTRYESRQEIVSYHAKYRYKGNKFWTHIQYYPGKHIKVRGNVRPLHDDF